MRLTWPAPPGRGLGHLGFAEVYLGIGVLAVVVARFFPFEAIDQAGGLYHCPSLTLFDLPCLTCGFTRAWVRVASGEIGAAFAVSPLGASTFIALCAFVVFGVSRIAFGLAWPRFSLSRKEGRWIKLGLVTVVLVNWAYLIHAHRVLGTWQ